MIPLSSPSNQSNPKINPKNNKRKQVPQASSVASAPPKRRSTRSNAIQSEEELTSEEEATRDDEGPSNPSSFYVERV